MIENNYKVETQLIHDARLPDPASGQPASTIDQRTAPASDRAEDLEAIFAGRAPGYVYSRIGNPTVARFERRMARLENGIGAVACGSGMAAISAAVMTLAGTGDEIVAGGSLFGGTWSLLTQTLPRFGITARLVESTDPQAYARAITDRTRLLFVETIGNPKLDVPDLAAIAGVARQHGVVMMVDNTVATPVLCRPKSLGADVVIHSTSKFVNGHGNAIGGVIVDCGTADWSGARYTHLHSWHARAREQAFLACLRNAIRRDLGACLAPFNAFLSDMGLESLAVRMDRHCANAERVARYLAADTRVPEVRYPGLQNHPDHHTARRQFDGRYGALLTLRLRDQAQCFHFINGLKLARNLANLGDAGTLVIHPASTFCRDLPEAARRAVGVSDDVVRLSVGLEHADDLVADLAQSLDRMEAQTVGTH